jgi:hypothetical protein
VAKCFFPTIELDRILEISFELARYFNCSPFQFDQVDFFEFNWMFEKLVMEKQKMEMANSNNQNIMALTNMMNG